MPIRPEFFILKTKKADGLNSDGQMGEECSLSLRNRMGSG
jgi:hypothetical protein